MMKKAFTLLELVVVIVILGVLATLGFTQYGRMVERGRGAEARMNIGLIRKLVQAYYLQNGTVVGAPNSAFGIGAAPDQLPDVTIACTSAFYFAYNVVPNYGGDPNRVMIQAWRCGATGKAPSGTCSDCRLEDNYYPATGSDEWRNTNYCCW